MTTTTTLLTSSRERRARLCTDAFPRLQSGLRKFAGLLLCWQERREQRRALAALDDRLLRDIGVSCARVRREAARPFWR